MIVITGSSRGIGKFLFDKYQKLGEPVIGIYKSSVINDSFNLFKVDVADEQGVHEWVMSIEHLLKDITLINCAGINYSSIAHKSDLKEWKRVLDVNLFGSFNLIHSLLPIMRDQNFGRIILLSSVVAQIAIPGTSAYAASKAGLWGLIKPIALESAKKGITINNINLGYFNIGMINELTEEIKKEIERKIPCGFFGDSNDIFNTVEYIRSTSYLNGSNINLNGGLF